MKIKDNASTVCTLITSNGLNEVLKFKFLVDRLLPNKHEFGSNMILDVYNTVNNKRQCTENLKRKYTVKDMLC